MKESTMTLALLASYFMAMMLSLTPLSQHAFYEKSEVTSERYTDLATTIAEGVLAETMPDSERLKVGAVMVSIGNEESHWRADVVTCKKGGDHDRAWGPWQTQLPKEQVCENTRAALKLAIGMVKHSFLMCKHRPVADRLSWYTDGGQWNSTPDAVARSSRRSQWRMRPALVWVQSHPFTVNVASSNVVALEAP